MRLLSPKFALQRIAITSTGRNVVTDMKIKLCRTSPLPNALITCQSIFKAGLTICQKLNEKFPEIF